jgi:hypothetical protein
VERYVQGLKGGFGGGPERFVVEVLPVNRFHVVICACFFILAGLSPALGDEYAGSQDDVKGADYRLVGPISCSDTTISKMAGRLGGDIVVGTGGTYILFANGVSVVSYGSDRVVDQERVGDKVQTCFLGRVVGTQSCDPTKDHRGYMYRVYDYKLHQAYTMMNSEHACGGA